MSKAEERAQAAYPTWRNGIGDEFSSNSAYYGFIEGYQQAEKDLALTCEDINTIIGLYNDLDDKMLCNPKRGCKEILKQFKERKEK